MGVPAFFRWISEKYPKIVVRAIEERGKMGVVDATQANPNGYEFDNLYLDMNGLIHPCTHPEGEEAPPTEEDMYVVIFRYLDRLFNLVRPRKVIYMAIDGVAPRAKMNQQRSRRFRSAQEAAEAAADSDRLRREMISNGQRPPPKKPEPWDSNVITPGTKFMAKLSEWLRYYIVNRLNTNPAYKNVRIVLSDAQSPGEGEHKIMQFIRRERAEPGYDPNTSHILYGLDADLIMLGLASHEIYFTILREEVLFGKAKKKTEQGYKIDAVLHNPDDDEVVMDGDLIGKKQKPFDLVKIWILREYLQYEMRPETFYQRLPFEYNFEAVIDDFVFICFFVGNDFLPHLPSLSIREGGLELLVDLYKRVLPTVGGYLTKDGVVNLERVDVFMGNLGTVEDEIFRRRRDKELWDKKRRENNRNTKRMGGQTRAIGAAAMADAKAIGRKRKADLPPPPPDDMIPLGRGRNTKAKLSATKVPIKPKEAPGKQANKAAAALVRAKLEKKEEPKKPALTTSSFQKPKDEIDEICLKNYEADDSVHARKAFEAMQSARAKERNIDDSIVDDVRFGEQGWKDRYYVTKFGKDYRDPNSAERRAIVKSYVTGLCWVMEYYYRGVQSWTWFYDYHYAPFASDLVNIDKFDIKFPPSQPFKPIDQLMGVFPPASAHALPEPCRWFMCNIDSPIADFYPRDFAYDSNGKSARWLWVALLPFIDEKRLLKVTRSIESEFSDEDHERNKCNPDLVFSNIEAPGTKFMLKAASDLVKRQEARAKFAGSETALEVAKTNDDSATPTTAGDVRAGSGDCGRLLLGSDTNGICGYFMSPPEKFALPLGGEVVGPNKRHCGSISNNKVCVFEFRLPKLRPHMSVLLNNVKIPAPSLSLEELQPRKVRLGRGADVSTLLIEQRGRHPNERGGGFHNQQGHGYRGGGQGGYQQNHRQGMTLGGGGYQERGTAGGAPSWGSMEPRQKQHRPSHNNYGGYQQRPPQQHDSRYPPPYEGDRNRHQGYGGGGDHRRGDSRQQHGRYQDRNQPPPSRDYNRNPFMHNAPPPAGNRYGDTSRSALMDQIAGALQRRNDPRRGGNHQPPRR